MKLLVTGGLGHIGSKLISEYAKRKDIELIRILDNLSTQRYSSLFNLPKRKYEFIEADINDNLDDIMKDIDIVIHLAAITDAPATIDNKELTFKVNLEGVENVLKEASKAGVKKFLFPSTTSVYGEAEGIVDENYDNYKPASPYAEAKYQAEKLVQEAYKKYGLHTVVLRMGTIFGTSIGMRFHTAVNKFCYLAALNKPLTVWDSALNSKRPYLGLYDCLKAFYFLEKHGKPGELYNVLTNNFSIEQIINTIKKYKKVKIEITKSPLLNQKPYEVSDKKIRQLGFRPRDSLDGGIKSTLAYFSNIDNSNEK